MKKRIYLTAVLLVLILTSCSNSNINMVKDYVDELNPSLSLGEVFESYEYFTKTEWKEDTGKRGIKYVEFKGYYSDKKRNKEAIIKIQFPINKNEDNFNIGFEGIKDLSNKETEFENFNTIFFKQGDLIRCIYQNRPVIGLSFYEQQQLIGDMQQ